MSQHYELEQVIYTSQSQAKITTVYCQLTVDNCIRSLRLKGLH